MNCLYEPELSSTEEEKEEWLDPSLGVSFFLWIERGVERGETMSLASSEYVIVLCPIRK